MLWIVVSVFLFLVILETSISFWLNRGAAKNRMIRNNGIINLIKDKLSRKKVS